jgi:hypothetical protein
LEDVSGLVAEHIDEEELNPVWVAEEREIPLVQKKLEEILTIRKRISLSNAIDVLKELRSAQTSSTTQRPS